MLAILCQYLEYFLVNTLKALKLQNDVYTVSTTKNSKILQAAFIRWYLTDVAHVNGDMILAANSIELMATFPS